jgi:hypothetical protein
MVILQNFRRNIWVKSVAILWLSHLMFWDSGWQGVKICFALFRNMFSSHLIEYIMKLSNLYLNAWWIHDYVQIIVTGFIMGPYYTCRGPCKSAAGSEEQVSSDWPGKVSCSLHLVRRMLPSGFLRQYAFRHTREEVCAGRRFRLFSTGTLCRRPVRWFETGWLFQNSSCLMPILLESKRM